MLCVQQQQPSRLHVCINELYVLNPLTNFFFFFFFFAHTFISFLKKLPSTPLYSITVYLYLYLSIYSNIIQKQQQQQHQVPLHQLEGNKDTRTVKLPKSLKKRRKPFINASVVGRTDAYRWYRATQRRLVDTFDHETGKKTNKLLFQQIFRQNPAPKQEHDNYVIESLTPTTYDSTNDVASEYIDIQWTKR